MTTANDPFEEYLRKKKVELLESKFRDQAEEAAEAQEKVGEYRPLSNDDPEREARLQEEADDFVASSSNAGAELFEKAGSDLIDNKVEEIRDALDDVFEEDVATPQKESADQAFVDFFRQVDDEYEPPAAGSVRPAPADAAPVVADAPPAEPVEPVQRPGDVPAAVTEVSTEDLVAVEVPADRDDSRLNLNDILTPPEDEAELVERVELLGRLVAKLVERVKLPENEIIEVLIKSGVEF